jgi:hypothetical protein
MPLILLVNPQADPVSGQLAATQWPLPPDTDKADLWQRLIEGMAAGRPIEVTVLLPESDRQQGTLLLNGSLLASVLIVRAPDQLTVDQPPPAVRAESPDNGAG